MSFADADVPKKQPVTASLDSLCDIGSLSRMPINRKCGSRSCDGEAVSTDTASFMNCVRLTAAKETLLARPPGCSFLLPIAAPLATNCYIM